MAKTTSWHGLAVQPCDIEDMELFGWKFICYDSEGMVLMYAII
jgi:hypothetical protein